MFCKLSDLKTESDVELKLIMPLLTAAFPLGSGFSAAEIYTKEDIRHFLVDKGASAKMYRPDFVLVLNGVVVAVIEAKSPSEDVLVGLREARLYAAELNAMYPSGMNPCVRILACNGHRLVAAPYDHHAADHDLPLDQLSPASEAYHAFLKDCSKAALLTVSDKIARALRPQHYWRAQDLLGGLTARNEDIGYNSFGRDLSFEFEHLFDPKTPEQRANIVRNSSVCPVRKGGRRTDWATPSQ